MASFMIKASVITQFEELMMHIIEKILISILTSAPKTDQSTLGLLATVDE